MHVLYGDLYISHFVFEPKFKFRNPSLASTIKPIKAIKLYFEEKFYGFTWKGEYLPLMSVLIYAYEGSPSGGYTMNTNLYCSDLD